MGAKLWNQWLHQHWVSSFMILFQAFTLNQPFTQYSPSFSWVPFEVCFGSLSTHCVLLSTQQSNFAALGWIWAEGLASKCAIVQNVDCSESSLSACGTGYLRFTRLHSSRTCLAFLGSLGSDWHNLIKRWAWGSMQTPTADFKWTLNNKNNHSSTISAISVYFLYSTGQWSTNLCIFSFVVFSLFFDWDNEMSTIWRVFYSWLFGMKGVFAIEMIETILWSSTMVVINFFTFVSQLSFSRFVYFDSCFQHVVGS